tara:strand:+ start:407 stop:916 length:510 start_codon:yes stop_codon:yes gene_type:complete
LCFVSFSTFLPNTSFWFLPKSIQEKQIEARAKFQRKKNVRVRQDDGVVDFASIPDVPKSPEDSIFLTEALKKQWLFASMDSEALSMVINKMTTRDYKQGDEIVKQGEEGIEVRVYVYVYVCLSTGHNQKPNIFFLMCFLFLFCSFHFLFFPLFILSTTVLCYCKWFMRC